MVKSEPKQADPVLKINANFHSSLDLYVPKPKISAESQIFLKTFPLETFPPETFSVEIFHGDKLFPNFRRKFP